MNEDGMKLWNIWRVLALQKVGRQIHAGRPWRSSAIVTFFLLIVARSPSKPASNAR
jgi:hypothetical protein